MKHTKFIALMLSIVLMLTMFPVSLAFAKSTDTATIRTVTQTEENVDPWEIIVGQGKCGEDLEWCLRGSGDLTITGSGDMFDYEKNKAPWLEFADSIKYVDIDQNVSSLCRYAFLNCRNLTNVYLPENNIKEIPEGTFSGCSALEWVSLPLISLSAISILSVILYRIKKS